MRMHKIGKFAVISILSATLVACGGSRAVLWHGKNATPDMVAARNAAIVKPGKAKAIVPVYVATSREAQNN